MGPGVGGDGEVTQGGGGQSPRTELARGKRWEGGEGESREKELEEPQWCVQSPDRGIQGLGEKHPPGKRGGRPGGAG